MVAILKCQYQSLEACSLVFLQILCSCVYQNSPSNKDSIHFTIRLATEASQEPNKWPHAVQPNVLYNFWSYQYKNPKMA